MPDSIDKSPRLEAAIAACEGAGAALRTLRGRRFEAEEKGGGQLKTVFDRAAEGWVLELLGACFPDDAVLAEERHEAAAVPDAAPPAHESYWTVDALDGTRSYVDGFKGFCAQVAWVEKGVPSVGVVHRPTSGATYFAVRGRGAWVRLAGGSERRLPPLRGGGIGEPGFGFVDSVEPDGDLGSSLWTVCDRMVEMGSYGLKLVVIATGRAGVFVKKARFALWDVAPSEVLLHEVGGAVQLWNGQPIDYAHGPVLGRNLIASASADLDRLREHLCRESGP